MLILYNSSIFFECNNVHANIFWNLFQEQHNNNSFLDGDEEDTDSAGSSDNNIINSGEWGGIVRCTGNLGKVLKESVQIAFTYAKVSDNHNLIHIN